MQQITIHVTPSNIHSIFTAIEADLRALIVDHLEGLRGVREILGENIWEKSGERQLNDQNYTNESLQNLLLFTDFADLYHILNTQQELLPKLVAKHVKEITPVLDKLVPVRNRIAHNRPLYYDDCILTEQFVQSILYEQDMVARCVKTQK